jgi:hypothetical protein
MHPRVLGLLLAATAAGCGETVDDRRLELDYVTAAVFAPSCGQTQCHSTFSQVDGFVFDTPEGVRQSLLVIDAGGINALLRFDYDRPDPTFSVNNRLYQLISRNNPFASVPRMPLDAPLPNKDMELLRTWIKSPDNNEEPAGVGGYARGAQCNPEANSGFACDDQRVVRCGDDWNFGELVVYCNSGCKAVCDAKPCDPETMCRQ